jgi:hypothetical protein
MSTIALICGIRSPRWFPSRSFTEVVAGICGEKIALLPLVGQFSVYAKACLRQLPFGARCGNLRAEKAPSEYAAAA